MKLVLQNHIIFNIESSIRIISGPFLQIINLDINL